MSVLLIIVTSVSALLILLFVYARYKMKSIEDVAPSENIIHLNDKNFSNYTKNGVILVDFWAEWCAPCKMLAPTLNQIADETKGKVKVAKLNVDLSPSTAAKYKIRSIPTVIIFRNGKESKRIIGIKPKDVYLKELQN